MSDVSPRVLRPGHRIAVGQETYIVVRLDGTTVTVQDQHGELSAVLLGHLLTAPGFAALDAAPPRRAPQDGRLSVLDDAEQRRIRWLEGHLIEMETGRPPEGPPRPECDPDLHSMDTREKAKLADLEAAGTRMTQRHLQRLRQAYRDEGLIGLADKRALRSQTPSADADPRVIEAIEKMLADPGGRSTVARSVMLTNLQQELDDAYGPGEVPMPSRATFYRLMNHADEPHGPWPPELRQRVLPAGLGKQAAPPVRAGDCPQTGRERGHRHEQAGHHVPVRRRGSPQGGAHRDGRHGDQDHRRRHHRPDDEGRGRGRVLARMLVPEPMRPGWAESLHHAHSVIPHERLMSIDERFANAAAKPVIIPETINCDRGRVYLSETFLRACTTLGISVQPASPPCQPGSTPRPCPPNCCTSWALRVLRGRARRRSPTRRAS